MNAELYFVGRFKDTDDNLLFITDGPFIEQEQADTITNQQNGRGRCYSKTLKTTLHFEIAEQYT